MEKSVYWLRQYGKSHSRRSDCQQSGIASGKSDGPPPPRIKSPCMTSSASTPAESAQVAQIADIIFAAVKHGIMIKVLSEITSSLNKDSLVVSIAAGVTLDQLAARWAMTGKLSAPCRTLPHWLMPG